MYITDIKKSTIKKIIANFRQICYIYVINNRRQRSNIMKYKTLSTEDNYKKNLNKENGKQKVSETETEPFNQLVTADQIRVNKFMQNHPELTTSAERTKYFKNLAAKELIEVRNENEALVAAGKAPLASADYDLLLPKEGVIKSAWRAKQEHQMKKEAIKSRVSMYNDALGNGAREF